MPFFQLSISSSALNSSGIELNQTNKTMPRKQLLWNRGIHCSQNGFNISINTVSKCL